MFFSFIVGGLLFLAVVKLSRSGKQLLFVDDDGRVFVTSVFVVRRLFDSGSAGVPVLLSR